jgi:hypothetical protein
MDNCECTVQFLTYYLKNTWYNNTSCCFNWGNLLGQYIKPNLYIMTGWFQVLRKRNGIVSLTTFCADGDACPFPYMLLVWYKIMKVWSGIWKSWRMVGHDQYMAGRKLCEIEVFVVVKVWMLTFWVYILCNIWGINQWRQFFQNHE